MNNTELKRQAVREKIIAYMGKADLTIKDISQIIGRSPLTIWNFLNNKTKPHLTTLWRLNKLVCLEPQTEEEKNNEKFLNKTRSLTKSTIQKGQTIRPEKCSLCGKQGKVEVHHLNYSNPLDISWLCKNCHEKNHHEYRHREAIRVGIEKIKREAI